MMLSQRSVARFQRVLAGLMQRQFYGERPALDEAGYYNALFEADVPRPLLDTLGRLTMFVPVPLTLALYEGRAVAETRGSRQISEADRRIGGIYLLRFIAVALRTYEQLSWDHKAPFEEHVGSLLESLEADGFKYSVGVIYETTTTKAMRPIPLDSSLAHGVVTAESRPTSAVEISPDHAPLKSEPRADATAERAPRSDPGWTAVRVAIVSLLVTAIGILVGVFNAEVHNWLKGLWLRWFE